MQYLYEKIVNEVFLSLISKNLSLYAEASMIVIRLSGLFKSLKISGKTKISLCTFFSQAFLKFLCLYNRCYLTQAKGDETNITGSLRMNIAFCFLNLL